MKIQKKQSLTSQHKSAIKKKIAHYFRGLRSRMRVTQSAFSESSGYTEAQVKQLEQTSRYCNLTNSYENLCEAASLEGMPLNHFLATIDGDFAQASKQAALLPWEKILRDRFAKLSLTERRDFIHKFLANLDDDRKFSELLRTIVKIHALATEDRKLVAELIHRLSYKETR